MRCAELAAAVRHPEIKLLNKEGKKSDTLNIQPVCSVTVWMWDSKETVSHVSLFKKKWYKCAYCGIFKIKVKTTQTFESKLKKNKRLSLPSNQTQISLCCLSLKLPTVLRFYVFPRWVFQLWHQTWPVKTRHLKTKSFNQPLSLFDYPFKNSC